MAVATILVLLPAVAAAQELTVPAPANVRVQGMPPIPQSIVDGLGRYAQFRQAQMTAWHPAKRQVLITTSFGTAPQLHLVDGPGRYRRQLTWFPSPSIPVLADASFDPADGNTILFQYDPGGAELRSLYRFDLVTGEPALVTPSKTRFTHVWSRQGKWVAYDSAERNGRDRDLYVLQPADPATKRRLAEFEGAWQPQDWSPDGATLLASENVSNAETYLWRIDIKTGEKKAITPRDGEKVAWFNARFSADGRTVYAMSDRGAGDPRIWRCPIAACKWTPVTADGVMVDLLQNFELSGDGTTLATTVDKGAYSELQVIDLTTLKTRPVPSMPKGIVTRISWRPGSREVAFTLATAREQGDVYSVDTSLGTMVRWTTSETTFNTDTLPAAEVIEWTSFDGVTISGILYRPPAKFTGPRPVMINIHGGPDLRERIVFRGRSNYLLNELGVAIIFPNVRGSAGSGREFEALDNGRLRHNAIKDIGALLDWIGTRPELDKSRVVLNGNSSGGWLALAAGAEYNARIRGIIEGAGITNFVTFLEQTDPARQDNRRQEYGDERDPKMREYLQSLSPVTRAADLKKPVLIIHPGKDPRVPVSQAQDLLAALKPHNNAVWYLEFTELNHDNLGALGGNYLLASWMWFFRTYVLN
jgi:dipeptidyl aminopeptidase/acylaminoacyl peptidase